MDSDTTTGKKAHAKRSSLSWDIPPFYDPNNNTASHPTLPILLAQTEITVHHPPKLLAVQEIAPNTAVRGPDRHDRTRVHFHGASKKAPLNHAASAPPSRSSPAPESSHAQNVSNAPSAGNPSARDSDGESEFDGLIPKPAGEAGRPSRGGYNLQKELGWPAVDYMRCKKFIKEAVKTHLDTSKKYSAQPAESLQTIQALASDKFPILADYSDWWPAADFIRLELKYTCCRARTEQQKQDAAVGRAVQSKRTRAQ